MKNTTTNCIDQATTPLQEKGISLNQVGQHDIVSEHQVANERLEIKFLQQEELKQSEILSLQNQSEDITKFTQTPLLNRSIHLIKQLKSKPVELIIFSYLPMVEAQILMRSLAHVGIAQSKNLITAIQDQRRHEDLTTIIIKMQKDFDNEIMEFETNKTIVMDFKIVLKFYPKNKKNLDAFMQMFHNQINRIKKLELRNGDHYKYKPEIFEEYYSDQKIRNLQAFAVRDEKLFLPPFIVQFFINQINTSKLETIKYQTSTDLINKTWFIKFIQSSENLNKMHIKSIKDPITINQGTKLVFDWYRNKSRILKSELSYHAALVIAQKYDNKQQRN
eukprot:403364492